MKSSKQYIVAIILSLGIVIGVSSLQAAWDVPDLPPPQGNVDAPLNTGLDEQTKKGPLILNGDLDVQYPIGLQVFGKAIFNDGLQIPSGAGAGKVLVSDIEGNVVWNTLEEVIEEEQTPLYNIEFLESYSTGAGGAGMGYVDRNAFCKINTIDGHTTCKKGDGGINIDSNYTYYGDPGILFTATTEGSYDLSCNAFDNDFFACCRMDRTNGNTQCKAFNFNSNYQLSEWESPNSSNFTL